MITIETLFLLKSVPLFAYTSDDILLELAFLLKELYVAEGETIIKKGEFGQIMYIIAKGRVKVHDGDIMLAELGELDVFGELAALSPEVRTASVTAIENCMLFAINHQLVYDMMERHIGLVKGIIEVLCQRTRSIAARANKS